MSLDRLHTISYWSHIVTVSSTVTARVKPKRWNLILT